jgi:hypothetical protein
MQNALGICLLSFCQLPFGDFCWACLPNKTPNKNKPPLKCDSYETSHNNKFWPTFPPKMSIWRFPWHIKYGTDVTRYTTCIFCLLLASLNVHTQGRNLSPSQGGGTPSPKIRIIPIGRAIKNLAGQQSHSWCSWASIGSFRWKIKYQD